MPYEYDGSFEDQQQYGDRANINDATLAGGPDTAKKVLVFMPKEAGGTADDGALTENLTDAAQVRTLFGDVAARAFAKFRNIASLARVDAIAVPESGTGVAATFTVTFTGDIAADGGGVVTANLGGYKVDFTVAAEDDPTAQALAAKTAINADANCPWTAESVLGVLTGTYKYKGETGNSPRVEIEDDDDVLTNAPTVSQPATEDTGANNPSLAGYQDTVTESDYRIVVPAFVDSTNMEELETWAALMTDEVRAQGAMFILGFKGSSSEAIAFAEARQRWDFCAGHLKTAYNWMESDFETAMIEAAYHARQSDPSVPFHQQERVGLTLGTGGTKPTRLEIENGVRAGVSTYCLNEQGVPMVHTAVTTCTELESGETSTAKSSPHIFYTSIETRRYILQKLRDNNATPEQKKLVDGKSGDIRGVVVQSLYDLTTKEYEWLSKTKLDQIVDKISIVKSTTNLQRTAGGAALPLIQDHRGTDLTLWLIAP